MNSSIDPYSQNLSVLSIRINTISLFILCPLGILLGIVCLLIYCRKSLNKTNMGFLYFWQSMADIFLLSATLFLGQSMEIFGVYFTVQAQFFCKFFGLMSRFVAHISSWMTVYICFDRFMFVYFPTKSKFMTNKINSSLMILGMFCCIALINTPALNNNLEIRMSLNSNNQTSIQRVCSTTVTISNVMRFITSLMRTILPVTIIAILNVLIIKKLKKRRVIVTSALKTTNREQKFTKIVIGMNLLFLTFNLPLTIGNIFGAILSIFNITASGRMNAIINFYQTIAFNFAFLNQSLFFFILFIFNRVFRNEVLSFLSFIKKNRPTERQSKTKNSLF
jgi:hypothetical protein